MAFDLFDNIEYRDSQIFYPWAKAQLKDEEKYYFLLDEVHMYPLSFSEFMTIYDGNRYGGWNEYFEDAFLIEEARCYDIKGKSYIGTPMKYYFMDMGLRNSRINFRQVEVTHSMANVICNELRMRGFSVDVGGFTGGILTMSLLVIFNRLGYNGKVF